MGGQYRSKEVEVQRYGAQWMGGQYRSTEVQKVQRVQRYSVQWMGRLSTCVAPSGWEG